MAKQDDCQNGCHFKTAQNLYTVSPSFFLSLEQLGLTTIYPEKSTVRVAWMRPVNGSIPEREVLAGESVEAVGVVLDVGTGRVFFLQVVKLHRDGLPVWTRQT